MEADLTAAMVLHSKASVQSVQDVADDMAMAAKRADSPLYGYTVDSKTTDTANGSTVTVTVNKTGTGIGTVYGGEKAVAKGAMGYMDTVAKAAGL